MKQLQDATVRWFDNKSGEGFIRVGDESIYVHYSAIDKNKGLLDGKFDKDFYWRVLFSGQKVKVSVIRDSHYTQIDEVV